MLSDHGHASVWLVVIGSRHHYNSPKGAKTGQAVPKVESDHIMGDIMIKHWEFGAGRHLFGAGQVVGEQGRLHGGGAGGFEGWGCVRHGEMEGEKTSRLRGRKR